MQQPPILFNVPHITGKELGYLEQALGSGKLSGNGAFAKLCQSWLEARYHFGKALLTTSCTDALEMCALLAEVGPGDEVILPAYTFVSTANAFALRGARLVFADSRTDDPNMDVGEALSLITPRTKAICAVHYAGVATDLDPLLEACQQHNLLLIEDAAQAVDGYYKGKPLGSIGQLAAFSFHETKNIISGEGGLFVSNDPRYHDRAEIIWEKGTNRMAFFRGQVDKYNWVDIGSSFLPSELNAAFLWAQLEHLDEIQAKRKHIWRRYFELLAPLQQAGKLQLPVVPAYSEPSGNLFYLVCQSLGERQALMDHLKSEGIMAVFHYQRLHNSPFYADKHDGRPLPQAERFADHLLRLPLHYSISEADQLRIAAALGQFYGVALGKS